MKSAAKIDRWTVRGWAYALWLRLPQRLRRVIDPNLRVSEWASPSRPELSDGEEA